jgi:hypothetical protein
MQEMSTQEQYLELLDLTYEVAQSLEGKLSANPYLPDCQQLAAKLFYHAATIYQLRQGTKTPVPYSEKGSFFYDFPSVAVLTRAALETYLAMFEVFFEPATDDEFEFSHALWQLSGFIIREKFPLSDPVFQNQVTKSQQEIQEMRERLRHTEKFSSLKHGEQEDVLKGKRRRNWASLARAAGFGEQTIRQIYSYHSGYVHADGLSGTQIVSLKTAQDQIEFIEAHMHTVMIVLSKMILQYAEKFPEAKAMFDKNPGTAHIAKVWSGAASFLP